MPDVAAFEHLAVIGGDHDIACIQDTFRLETVEQATELEIDVGNVMVV